MLGYFLYEGLHVPADPASALVWFTRAANRGDILAQAWLGDVLATGKGVPKDRDASKMWYERAAAQGHVGSLLALTAMASPPGQNPEEDAALFEQWLKAAEGGDALAQRMVGDFRIRGVRCKQSVGEGAMWLRMASEQGNAAAKLILSGLIISGSVAPDHPNEAANLMQQAAVQGSVEASYNLGVCYRLGVGGVSTDAGTAMEWYRRAANQDYAPAQLELGDLLLEVSASEEALSEARTWYSAASRAGLAKASLHLGRMHEVGVGAPKNQQLAMQFYQRAADAGLREGAAGVQRCSVGRI